MRLRGARAAPVEVPAKVVVEEVVIPVAAPVEEVPADLPVVSAEYASDVRPPNPERMVVKFSDSLVVENTDERNWTLLERRGPITEGSNAGKYRWVELGYYRGPAGAFARVLRMELVKALGVGSFSLHEVFAKLAPLEQGLGPLVEAQLRAESEQKGARDAYARALKVVKGEEDRKRLQELVDGKPGARR